MYRTLLLLPVLVFVLAADWDRFRGPNGTGISDDKNVPVKWTAKNVRWKVELPGKGHSSPIVVKDRVFLASATKKARIMLCYDAQSGKQLWRDDLPGGEPEKYGHPQSSLASATPCSDGERVYIVFWDGKGTSLHAYDLDGKPAWKNDLGPFTSQHGPGFSPMLAAGKVIVNVDQDGKADLIAFDAKTGKQSWKVAHKAFRACYSTPFLHEKKLIVTTTAGLTAYDPEKGEKGWSYQWKFPTTMPLRTVGSSVVLGDMIFGCSGDGDGTRNMIGVKLPSSGGKPTLAWQVDRDETPYVPTIIGKGDHIYTAFDKGFLICREAKTGEVVWTHRLSSNVSASLVMIDGKIYAFADNGDVTVFEATPKGFTSLAVNKLGEGVLASPAVANGRLYVRGAKHLFCIGQAKEGPARERDSRK